MQKQLKRFYDTKHDHLKQALTVSKRLIASALLDSAIASEGVVPTPPKISETTGPMTMKFLPDAKLSGEARNQKKILA